MAGGGGGHGVVARGHAIGAGQVVQQRQQAAAGIARGEKGGQGAQAHGGVAERLQIEADRGQRSLETDQRRRLGRGEFEQGRVEQRLPRGRARSGHRQQPLVEHPLVGGVLID